MTHGVLRYIFGELLYDHALKVYCSHLFQWMLNSGKPYIVSILSVVHLQVFFQISDFGLSQYLKKDEAASSFRGSPLYMAPEIFTRQKYDSRVDLWYFLTTNFMDIS